MENTLKSGACPKCNSTDVYTTHGIPKRGERMRLVITSWKWFFLDTYICTKCGNFEEFICDEDLGDERLVGLIKENYAKVK